LAGPRKNKDSKFFQKIFYFNFEAKHTKGLKPGYIFSGYRNLFTEEKVWWTGKKRPETAKNRQISAPENDCDY